MKATQLSALCPYCECWGDNVLAEEFNSRVKPGECSQCVCITAVMNMYLLGGYAYVMLRGVKRWLQCASVQQRHRCLPEYDQSTLHHGVQQCHLEHLYALAKRLSAPHVVGMVSHSQQQHPQQHTCSLE